MGFFSELDDYLTEELEAAGAKPMEYNKNFEDKFVLNKHDSIICTGKPNRCVAKLADENGEDARVVTIKNVTKIDVDAAFNRQEKGTTTVITAKESRKHVPSCAVGKLAGKSKLLLCRSSKFIH